MSYYLSYIYMDIFLVESQMLAEKLLLNLLITISPVLLYKEQTRYWDRSYHDSSGR
jgi:hypothetical protein